MRDSRNLSSGGLCASPEPARDAANALAERQRKPRPVADPPAPGQRTPLLDAVEGRLQVAVAPGPPNALLDAIEGRGQRREPRLKMGLGLACVFEPAEVQEYAQALARVDEAALRASLDFALMDTLNLPIADWQQEGESTFAECILPDFLRLQAFYANAASAQQHVLVWHD